MRTPGWPLSVMLMAFAAGACGDDDTADASSDGGSSIGAGDRQDAGDPAQRHPQPDAGKCYGVQCGACQAPLTIHVSALPPVSLELAWSAHIRGEGVDCDVTAETVASCVSGAGDYRVVIKVDGSEVDAREVEIEATQPAQGACCDCGYIPVTIDVQVPVHGACDGADGGADGGADEDASAC